MANLDKQYTNLAASVHVGADAPADAKAVILQAEDKNVRVRLDGADPTASVGLLLTAGGVPVRIDGVSAVRSLRAIQAEASAKLTASFVVS